jgi:integrase
MAASAAMATSQPAASEQEITKAVELAPDLPVKVALILTWLCAGRVGDVLKLTRADVTLGPTWETTGELSVLFKIGKGARFSQPYLVPTVCPPAWRLALQQFLRPKQPATKLFPGDQARHATRVNAALRSANPTYTVRALRRGALQLMANQGADFPSLMVFSGHKRVDTLLRYLDWGAHAATRSEEARQWARSLGAQVG